MESILPNTHIFQAVFNLSDLDEAVIGEAHVCHLVGWTSLYRSHLPLMAPCQQVNEDVSPINGVSVQKQGMFEPL